MSERSPRHLPPLSPNLIATLERLFPDRCPDINTPENVIFFNAGAASVVRFMRQEYERQQSEEDFAAATELSLQSFNTAR